MVTWLLRLLFVWSHGHAHRAIPIYWKTQFVLPPDCLLEISVLTHCRRGAQRPNWSSRWAVYDTSGTTSVYVFICISMYMYKYKCINFCCHILYYRIRLLPFLHFFSAHSVQEQALCTLLQLMQTEGKNPIRRNSGDVYPFPRYRLQVRLTIIE